jgi:GGDEF domain-containing protein
MLPGEMTVMGNATVSELLLTEPNLFRSVILMCGIGLVLLAVLGTRSLRSSTRTRWLSPAIKDLVSVPVYRSALPSVDQEVARARRHNRPLSVAVLRCCKNVSTSDPDCDDLLRFTITGAVLRGGVRCTDIVTVGPGSNEFVLFLPEMNTAGASSCLDRLSAVIQARVGLPLVAGIGELSVDGYTVDELVKFAQSRVSVTGREIGAKPAPATMGSTCHHETAPVTSTTA